MEAEEQSVGGGCNSARQTYRHGDKERETLRHKDKERKRQKENELKHK